jgi:pimeloyl-ACP methyl ester carboxylesterase
VSPATGGSLYPAGFAACQSSVTLGGHRIAYFDSAVGDSAGAPERSDATLLLIHGNLTSGYVYHRLLEHLPAGYRCVAPDLLGFGLSDKPQAESACSLASHMRIVGDLVAELELNDLVLVGHDWGGPIGLGAALADRARYRGLVLLNTLTAPVMRLPLRYRLPLAAVVRSDRLNRLLIRRLGLFQRLGLRGSLDAESRRIYAAANPTAASRAAIAAFPRLIPTSPAHPSHELLRDLLVRLRGWRIPALVLFSDRDLLFPAAGGRALAETLPDATFRVIRGARHFLQHEAPEAVAREIVRFVDSAERPTPSSSSAGTWRPLRNA